MKPGRDGDVRTPQRVAEAHPSREDCISCRLDCSTLKNAPLRTLVASYAVDLLRLVHISRLDASDST